MRLVFVIGPIDRDRLVRTVDLLSTQYTVLSIWELSTQSLLPPHQCFHWVLSTGYWVLLKSCHVARAKESILRKEVIQPQVPLRLPCYDLVPITELILGACLLAVDAATWDAPRFRGLTGGVYKAQEHIHRVMADTRLLAIPAS